MSTIKYIYGNNKPIIYFATLLIITGLSLYACNENTQDKMYTGKLIELNFQGVNSIENKHWVEIDGVRFTHYENMERANQDIYSLPASTYLYRDDDTDREFKSPGGDFSLAIQFGQHINMLSSDRSSEYEQAFENGITVANQVLLLTQGKLQLKSIENSVFSIRTPEDYPVSITVLE